MYRKKKCFWYMGFNKSSTGFQDRKHYRAQSSTCLGQWNFERPWIVRSSKKNSNPNHHMTSEYCIRRKHDIVQNQNTRFNSELKQRMLWKNVEQAEKINRSRVDWPLFNIGVTADHGSVPIVVTLPFPASIEYILAKWD